jgi:DNA-binding CsgD family transcriptional regulator
MLYLCLLTRLLLYNTAIMPNETHPLTEREQDVARVLLQGKSNKQIALELGISNRTVEFHLKNIYTKLEVASRTEAILKLTERGLLKTTGALPVESTVAETSDPLENDSHVISWRIPMKKAYYILGGVLLTLLLVLGIVLDRTPQNVDVPPTPGETSLPTQAESPTGTVTALVPTQTTAPTPERTVIPPHTVNGYTASIESYYIDVSHVLFQVRLTGTDLSRKLDAMRISNLNIYDEYGSLTNASLGIGPAADLESYQFGFVPVTLLKGDRFKGQLAFDLNAGLPDYNRILASFRFDVELPIYPEVRFYPKQTASANGIDMLLDSVTVTPVFTQAYLCFEPPGNEPWIMGDGSLLEMEGQEAPLYLSSGLFSSFTGSYSISEPYWTPPVKTGSCYKIGFQTGTSSPASLRLTIPEIENLMPFIQNPDVDLFELYPGLSQRQAYHTYLEEQGATHKGPWVFDVDLTP